MFAFTRRRLFTIAILTFAWCALWGEPSVANVASGLIVSAAVSSATIGTPARGRVRLRPLARFAGLVLIDLVKSTVAVAREVLTPTDNTDEAIIRVTVPADSRLHLLLLIAAVTVTPGTAVVDADPDTGVLYLHLLHAERRDETEQHVRDLAELACAALPLDVSIPEEAPR
ncbi:MAG: Na+/H+ antiporter subunit E [Acidimicrobiia bacterium]|nr:Na+/H+ antiporter subunit E [Acidimicrobiia bacterium]